MEELKVEYLSLEEIIPYVNNPKTHPQRQIQALMSSIKQFGYVAPIIVDKDNIIIAGHGRYEALKRLGYERIPVIRADGLTPEQARAYRIADNRIAELGKWDEELLAVELESLKSAGVETGFTDKEIEKLLTWVEEFENKEEAEEEEGIEIKNITQPGDIWELGKHKLICGDSTQRETYEKLLEDEKVNLVFTSPPYAEQRKEEYGGIPPEEYPEWFCGIAECVKEVLDPGGSFFVNIKEHVEDGERSLYFFETIQRLRQRGWRYVDRLIWHKRGGLSQMGNRLKDSFEDVHWLALSSDVDLVIREVGEEALKNIEKDTYEGMVFTDSYTEIYHFALEKKIKWRPRAVGKVGESFARRGKLSNTGPTGNIAPSVIKQERRGVVLPSNVLRFRTNRERWGHPAMFPVELPAFFIRLTTEKGDIVMDIFNGAGTTLIASEQLGRVYRGIELMPEYVDITVRRYIKFKGGTEGVYLIRGGERIPYSEAKTFSQA